MHLLACIGQCSLGGQDMPEFDLPSANCARAGASLLVWEKSEREHVSLILFISHKSFEACE